MTSARGTDAGAIAIVTNRATRIAARDRIVENAAACAASGDARCDR